MTAGFYKEFKPEDLPVPNKQIMELMQYTLRDDAKVEILARLISVNPGLTAQLLGLVNSAFFGFRHNINTISDAVVIMGIKRLRNLVLCFSVKAALSKKEIPGFDNNTFWEDSVRRGVAAQQMGYLVNGPVEEAFTAGMLQDIGLLALFSMEPEKVDRWALLRASLPFQRHEMEEQLFHTCHDSVGAILAEKWNLPESYVLAIGCHHLFFSKKGPINLDHGEKQTILAGIMHLSDLCNAAYTSHDKEGAITTLKKKSREFFGLTEDKIESLLSLLPNQVKETSKALNILVSSKADFNTIMAQASRKLVEDNISYQELTWQLQSSLKQRDEYAGKLEAELDVAREIQKSLQPDIAMLNRVGAFNIPAHQLSGDFYDYFSRKDGTICFCLGDVSGKGTSAALLMAKAVSLFRCLCKIGDDISQVIELMNNELCETAVRGMFVTFVAGWMDPNTDELSIINVGHPPPFLIDGKKIVKIDATSPPLGVISGVSHPVKHLSLKNSRLYLYTDGFTEGRLKKGAANEVGKELGLIGFLKWLIQSGRMSVDNQMEWIKEQCSSKLAPQSDDLTLLILSGE